MKSTLIKSLIGATTLTVGITALTWNGGEALTNAMDKIGGLTSIVTQYQGNETKLKDRVVTLNKEVSDKTAQISTLEAQIKDLEEQINNSNGSNEELLAQIEALKGEKATLEAQVNELTAQLNEAQGEVTRLEGELNKANGEITKANEQAQALQNELDKVNLEAFKPMTNEEVDNIINGGGGVVTPPPTQQKTWNLQGVYEDDYVKMEVNGSNIVVTNKGKEGVAQPIRVKFMNGETSLASKIVEVGTSENFGYANVSNATTIEILDDNSTRVELIIVK